MSALEGIRPRVVIRPLGQERILTLYPELMGTAALAVEWRRPGGPDGGFDAYFQYPSFVDGLEAIAAMRPEDDEPPAGWIRAAPPRFRRRPGGDPELEFVAP